MLNTLIATIYSKGADRPCKENPHTPRTLLPPALPAWKSGLLSGSGWREFVQWRGLQAAGSHQRDERYYEIHGPLAALALTSRADSVVHQYDGAG